MKMLHSAKDRKINVYAYKNRKFKGTYLSYLI